MNNPRFCIVFLLIITIGWAFPTKADIEPISATIKGGIENVQTQVKSVQDAAESVKKLTDTAVQGVKGVVDNVDEIVDVATDPLAAVAPVATSVMGGMQDKVDGSQNEDELIEDVTQNYTREFGADNSITEAKKLQAAINKNLGENVATLYARTLVLRQELMKEETPDPSLETITDALDASTEVTLTSLRRWNKILEMQAYINEFKNSLEIQNFTRDAGDSDNE